MMDQTKGYYTKDDCKLDDFAAICAQELALEQLAFTNHAQKNIPIYDAAKLMDIFKTPQKRRALMAEWAHVLRHMSGVLVIKNAVPDLDALDGASEGFAKIIAAEKGKTAGDHFAASGANDRIWNSLQKLCLAEPAIFARCFASLAIDTVSEAWLGKGYQMSAQVNLVRPGGKAQMAHRDYHLGFMTLEQNMGFGRHVHDLSPLMTLQGAVAHCDMPIESGPTKLLPFSQNYGPGYLAYHMEAFCSYFEDHYVQLPLEKGDALFFNPALFHGAGDNISEDIHRLANLLQVSSPMGRAMESLDRAEMAKAIYPVLQELNLDRLHRDAVIAACAEGYAFPTNLDNDPPVDGLAPKSQAEIMREMLDDGAPLKQFIAAVHAQTKRREA